MTTDELAITPSRPVPSRTIGVAAGDLHGADATGVGLLRRVENLARTAGEHRDDLAHRHDLALTRLHELDAVAEAPFEHAGDLADKKAALQTLTVQLQVESAGPAAAARRAERRNGWLRPDANPATACC